MQSVIHRIRNTFSKLNEEKAGRQCVAAGLFAPEWYARAYAKIATAIDNPVKDYFGAGWKAGRRPNAYFDPAWYLQHNPDVAAAGANPLLHYWKYGEAENRPPCPYFNPKWYRERYGADVGNGSPLGHYLSNATSGRYSPNEVFDVAFYLTSNPDVAAAGSDPFMHFMKRGYKQDRDPSAKFDVAFYAKQYMADDTRDPVTHYLEIGKAAGYPTLPARSEIAPKKTEPQKTEKLVDVQSKPVVFARDRGNPSVALMVDSAAFFSGRLVLHGWYLGDLKLEVYADDQRVTCEEVAYERADVAREFGPPGDSQDFGFALVGALARSPEELVLKWSSRAARITGQATLKVTRQPNDAWLSYLGFAAHKIIPLLAHDAKWLGHVIGAVSTAHAAAAVADGNIEYAGSLGELGGLVTGWAVARHDAELWLFDAAGHGEPLSTAIRVDRPDVRASLQQKYGDATTNAGFLLRWPNRATVGAKLKLAAVGRNGLQLVHTSDWKQAAHDPGAFAKLAFGVNTSSETFQDRMTRHDGVLIEQLLAGRQAELEQLPVDVWTFGTPPREPKASVIVPLYGRWDFIEHQLLDFSIDPDFQRSVELIYVIDDPRLVAMKERAEGLWKTYGVPFKLVWGHANRGFAGANNLGVRNAKGDVLVFLNSDAFAKGPGWVSQLQDKLLEHPDFGAIGVRLLFADGGIQHAGMVFAYEENLGVWINKHPMMGMDPSVDQRRGLVEVPAVTAACVAVRRDAFDAVGGFDGGFLFGDFEDSDLCLKLNERGYRIGYLPDVELVHLERQSFRELGDTTFRSRVVLYNAGRQTRRWAHHFAKLETNGAGVT